MRQKSFYKDLKRAISNSRSRFLSIMAMIALGVSFFAGINATKPDMILSADTYYKDYALSDFRVMSPLGFSEEDLEEVRSLDDSYRVMETYSKDVFLSTGEERSVIKLYSYALNEEEKLNRPMVTEGRLPEASGEILLEQDVKTFHSISVGDEVTISLPEEENLEDSFSEDTYTVVGFMRSPLYITYERGQTNIGDGSIDYFGYIPEEDFSLDKVTDLFIETRESKNLTAYSDAYDEYHKPMKDSLSEYGIFAMQRDTQELKDEISEGEAKLKKEKADAEEKLADAEQKLIDAENEINDGEKKLNENEARYTREFSDRRQEIREGKDALEKGRAEYAAGYNTWLTGYNAYQDGMAELLSSKATLDDARNQIEQGERDLASAEAQLEEAKNQIGLLTQALEGLKGIRAGLPEGTELTEEEYLSLIQQITMLSPELGAFLEANVPYDDPNLMVTLRGALDSTILELQETLSGAEAAYGEGVLEYESGAAALSESRKQYEQGLLGYEEGLRELEASKGEIDAGKAELDQAKATLDSSERELTDGEKKLSTAEAEFRQSIKDGRTEIAEGKIELSEGKAKFSKEKADALKKISEAEEEIRDAERMILEIPTEWFVYSRDGYPGYASLGDDAKRLGSLATVFPLFFFLVAALVCLTTMTRMVEEERVQIGTLKALGYKTPTIAMKYITYALLASLIGSIIGFTIGFQLFPRLIITVYGSMYSTPYIMTPFRFDLALLSTAIAVLTTVSASLFAALSELKETPANLMMPKAPKPGKRILLERITPLWKRMSFSYKVTFRNIFRYKKRFLMTVLGISGCTALLVTGFGIGNSVNAIMGSQFEDIFVYDGMVYFDEDKEDLNVETILGENSEIETYLTAHNESVSVYQKGSSREYETNLLIPEESAGLRGFIDLHDRVSKEEIELNEDGAVISEKLSKLLGVSVGDTLVYRDTDSRTYEFKISAVVENYLSHYIYMSPDYFKGVTLRDASVNAGVFTLSDPEGIDESAFNEQLLENEGVLGAMLVDTIQEEFGKSLESLDYVVFILVLAAGALAFVVLYNLTNINITERIREIATIKVLGFRDKEVSAYVYRENIFLTIIGTLVGLIIGFFFHRLVINTMEIDNMMFGRVISTMSYFYSMILTMGFAVFVNLFMYRKLQQVDMATSLKSVE
ncbi:FtsX-like permease family protein [Proteiniclasticum sp.]|uniref:FtsX-like permease family protein n=1 Tax=Proteiniclasticum sp. TaxID=2053595 RepID=UPI00289784DD|nr:FtsX-like permease family protein [Proteiniclasticum sp.]